MDIRRLITSDPGILSGISVFAGTRVPIQSLFDHLETGVPLDEFLEDFPSVSRWQAVALLKVASQLLTAKNIAQLYAAVA
jgi:uncharacterized protein (DUF433 family)